MIIFAAIALALYLKFIPRNWYELPIGLALLAMALLSGCGNEPYVGAKPTPTPAPIVNPNDFDGSYSLVITASNKDCDGLLPSPLAVTIGGTDMVIGEVSYSGVISDGIMTVEASIDDSLSFTLTHATATTLSGSARYIYGSFNCVYSVVSK